MFVQTWLEACIKLGNIIIFNQNEIVIQSSMPIKTFKQTQLPVFILQSNLEIQSKKIDMFYGFRNVVK